MTDRNDLKVTSATLPLFPRPFFSYGLGVEVEASDSIPGSVPPPAISGGSPVMEDQPRPEKRARLEDGSADPSDKDQPTQSRSSRACLNCRRHKMKCENANNPPCKRCAATGKSCIFQQRANAAWGPENSAWTETVEIRLHDLEAEVRRLRALSYASRAESEVRTPALQGCQTGEIAEQAVQARPSLPISVNGDITMERQPSNSSSEATFASQAFNMEATVPPSSAELSTGSRILHTISKARKSMPSDVQASTGSHPEAFDESVLDELWQHFDRLQQPEYHHCPPEVKAGATSPLLLFSVLHSAAWFHPSDRLASFAPVYAAHLSKLVSDMVDLSDTYEARPGQARALVGRGAYEEIIGLLLAMQTFKFHYRNIGAWITITCRLILNSYGKVSPEAVSDAEWRKLWRWLYHTESKRSFALLRPILVQEEPPSPPFLPLAEPRAPRPYEIRMQINAKYMARFTGRGLLGPIEQFWSFVATDHDHVVIDALSDEDLAVKRQWLAELEQWREKYSYTDAVVGCHFNVVHVHSIGYGAPNYVDEAECIEWCRKTIGLLDAHDFPRLRELQAVAVAFCGIKLVGSVRDEPQGANRDSDIRLVQSAIRPLTKSSPSRRCTADYLAMANRLHTKLDRLRTRLGLSESDLTAEQSFATSDMRTPVYTQIATDPYKTSNLPLQSPITPALPGPQTATTFSGDPWNPENPRVHSAGTSTAGFDTSSFSQAPAASFNGQGYFPATSPYAGWRPAQADTPDINAIQQQHVVAPDPTQPLVQNGQESWPPAFLSWLGQR